MKPILRRSGGRSAVFCSGFQNHDRPIRRPSHIHPRLFRRAARPAESIYNSTKKTRERIGRLLRMHANKREEIESIEAGDIAACVGLKNVSTGDTLCDEEKPIVLESIEFPAPVISVAMEPKTKADQEKMGTALGRLAQEDPTFRVHTDHGYRADADFRHGRIASGNHRRPHDARVQRAGHRGPSAGGVPRNDYQDAQAEGKYIRQTGGRGQYGHVKLTVHPLPQRQPRRHARAVHRRTGRAGQASGGQGRQMALRQGASLAVYRQDDRRRRFPANILRRSKTASRKPWKTAFWPATKWWTSPWSSIDGSYHEVDSSEMAFKIAGSMAFKEACRRANPKLLEPIMRVEVVVPEEYMRPGIRRFEFTPRSDSGHRIARAAARSFEPQVPLAEMFGYATDLRSRTQGRGSFTMHFSHYEQAPTRCLKKSLPRPRSGSGKSCDKILSRNFRIHKRLRTRWEKRNHGQGEIRAQ